MQDIHGELLKLAVDVSQYAAQALDSRPGSPSGELNDLRRMLCEFADGHSTPQHAELGQEFQLANAARDQNNRLQCTGSTLLTHRREYLGLRKG